MSEKHYVVSLHKGVDKEQFLNELNTSTSITDIPDREVSTVNERPISKRMLEVAFVMLQWLFQRSLCNSMILC